MNVNLTNAAVGFDFGNESCVVAVVRRGKVDVLQNEVGNRKTPSLVSFQARKRLVGDEAFAVSKNNYKNTISNIKQLLAFSGEPLSQVLASEGTFVKYNMVEREDGVWSVEVSYDGGILGISPEHLAATMLARLKAVAEVGLGFRVSECVIGVPAWWPDTARRTLLSACKLVNLHPLRLMHELTAVALSYGVRNAFASNIAPTAKVAPHAEIPTRVAFVDLGVSGLSAAVVEFQGAGMRVLGTHYEARVGGRDFDLVIYHHLAKIIKSKYKLDLDGPKAERARVKLLTEANRIKQVLSANKTVSWSISCLLNDTDVQGELERGEFETMCGDLLSRITGALMATITAAGGAEIAGSLKSVEVVGGAVRIPCVKQAISTLFSMEVSQTCDGDESVARGCALQCAMLSQNFKVREFEVADGVPNNIVFCLQFLDSTGKWEEDSKPVVTFTKGELTPCLKLVAFSGESMAKAATGLRIVAKYESGRFIEAWEVEPGAMNLQEGADRVKVKFFVDFNGVPGIRSIDALNRGITTQTQGASGTGAPANPSDKEPSNNNNSSNNAGAGANASAGPSAGPKASVSSGKRAAVRFKAVGGWRAKLAKPDEVESLEVIIRSKDSMERKALEARNALEGALFGLKAKLDEPKANPSPELRELVISTEEWLESEESQDASFADFETKLAALLKPSQEAERRQKAQAEWDRTIAYCRSRATTVNKAPSTVAVSQEARDKLLKACDSAEEWLRSGALSKPEGVTEQEAKTKELDRMVHSIFNEKRKLPQ